MTLAPEWVRATEILAALLGAVYVVLAARRNRLCWLAGAMSAALVGVLSVMKALPMQGALNAYYVGMSLYGYLNWSQSSSRGDLPVGTLPAIWHVAAALVLVPLSWISAEWLARETQAQWPLLDSLTTWFSLFATWMAARARLENWIYWIIIDGVLVYLYYKQGMPILALQFGAMTVLALSGFIAWRRQWRAQAVAA